jgi:glycosyltransferase involved in cell wall biosynthesis
MIADRPLKICFVCNELPPAPSGGIGPCVLTTAKGLANAGHDITVVGIYPQDYGWCIPGVKVVRVQPRSYPHTKLNWLVERLAIANAIKTIHKRGALDIVEWPDFDGLFVADLAHTTSVVRNHGPLMSHRLAGLVPKSRFLDFLELRTLRTIPNWIGVSHWFMAEWLRISQARPRHSTVIYNPVDCNLFRPDDQPRDERLILYAGNHIERKGVFALAAASRLFLPRLPGVRLLFTGRCCSEAQERIRLLAGDAACTQIEFKGAVPQCELSTLMRRCAVFAMPSILESFGNVWAEAMASGAPVLGSTLSAGPEVVPHEQAGILVDPRAHGQISDGIQRLMNDKDLRYRLGTTGRRVALDRYSLSRVLTQTVNFYRECISPPNLTARA